MSDNRSIFQSDLGIRILGMIQLPITLIPAYFFIYCPWNDARTGADEISLDETFIVLTFSFMVLSIAQVVFGKLILLLYNHQSKKPKPLGILVGLIMVLSCVYLYSKFEDHLETYGYRFDSDYEQVGENASNSFESSDIFLSNGFTIQVLDRVLIQANHWLLWEEEFPELFNLMFHGIYVATFDDEEETDVSSIIQFKFVDPSSVTFLSFSDPFSENWTSVFPNGIDATFAVRSDEMALNNSDAAALLLAEVIDSKTEHGTPYDSQEFKDSPVQFVYRSGDVGMAIAAKDMLLSTKKGPISLIPPVAKKEDSMDHPERKQ